ncbi:restriction endonuclease subunit S [Duganella sp. Leaf126]|uniref:restriction endonuclease subunit S n=1 Tax=Duganella sp. Leaf126 TaxID=1736266 RepID=UPI0009E89AC8|nr:restriction endonuclease subunit S [Duganella sp. Leaf126]
MMHWQETTLGDVCELYQPKTISSADLVDGGEYAVYGANGVIGRFNKFNHAEPQLLVTCRGATCGSVNISQPNSWINGNAMVVKPRGPSVELDYLKHLFKGGLNLTAVITGAAQPQITRQSLAPLKIRFPSPEEQRRISAILDKADALRGKRREALAQLDSLSQSIFLEMFGDPVTNPKGWPVVSLTDICHCYSGGTPSKALTELWLGKLPWFSAKDLKKNDLFDSQDHIAESVPETTSLKLLPANTVTICVRGMILAHTFPVSVLRIPATINQDLKALLPKKPLDAQYLAACLRAQSEFVLKQVSEAGHGTKRLDAAGLREIRVLQPPENLQKAFTSLVHSIEILRTQHRAAQTELDALFSALQYRAFRGEL